MGLYRETYRSESLEGEAGKARTFAYRRGVQDVFKLQEDFHTDSHHEAILYRLNTAQAIDSKHSQEHL